MPVDAGPHGRGATVVRPASETFTEAVITVIEDIRF